MKPLLYILFVFLPLGLWAQTDAPEPAKSSKSCGVRVDLGVGFGPAIPIIKDQYSLSRKTTAGEALSLTADVVFNKKQNHFYALASARIGMLSFKNSGVYSFGAIRQGHYTIVYSYDEENLFGFMAGAGGGVGYRSGKWQTTLKAGGMAAIDMSGNTNTKFGLYGELFGGIKIRPNTTLGLTLFYTNTKLEPTGPQYLLHDHDLYNLLSISAQVKVRLPCKGKR